MTQTLWLAGLLIANLWATGSFDAANTVDPAQAKASEPAANLAEFNGPGTLNNHDRGIRVLPGVAALPEAAITRTVYETPILSQIPYVGRRLFTSVGYSLDAIPGVPNLPRTNGDKTEEQPSNAGDTRTLILPAIKAGEKADCEEPPSNEEIVRALPTLARGIPYVYEQYRDEVEIVVEKLVDKVDGPRFFPLIGVARLHHCHWKCTVHYTDTIEIANPIPFTSKTRHTEVIYIDKDHLYLVDQNDQGAAETSEPPLSCPGGQYRPAKAQAEAATDGRKIYVIVDAGDDGEQVTALPAQEQTVLDAIESVRELRTNRVWKVRVSRVPSDGGERVTLPVDWKAIMERGYGASNYQLEAGDRVHVYLEADKDAKPGVPARTVARTREIAGPKLFVIVDDGSDGQQASVVPFDGQSVLDLIADLDAVTADNVKKIWIARPTADGNGDDTILPIDWKLLLQSGRAGVELTPGDRLNITLAPAKTPGEGTSIDDVIRMWSAGVSRKIILRQLELTNAAFDLSCDDIVYLRESGVSNRIIRAMQERRPVRAQPIVGTFLGRVHGENVGGSVESSVEDPYVPFPIQPVEAKAKNECALVAQVTAYWDAGIRLADNPDGGERLPGLLGHIWLANEANEKIEADGCLHVEMYDMTSDTPTKIAEWRFDERTLKTLKREDGGTGYALFLPWENYRREITRVELRVVYLPENVGQPQHAEPQVVHLRPADSDE